MCGNIQSIGQMGPHLTKLADAKAELQKKADEGSMEHFFELEKIRQQEAEIKQLFIYQGRAGLWEDYQKFMQTRRELKESERKRTEQAKARKRKQIKEWTIGIVVALAALSAIGICGYILYWLITTKGK